jgi:cell wall assembly regulator SMI1
METIWHRIEVWLAVHAPALVGSLQGPASTEEIERVQAALDITFPAALTSSLLIHNGQFVVGALEPNLIHGRLLPLERMCEDWRLWEDLRAQGTFDGLRSWPEGPVKPDWWNPRWIPVTRTWGGDYDCVDLDPAAGGASGQVIKMYHDDLSRVVLAPSFEAWLSDFAHGLETGVYVYGGDDVGVVRAEDV